MKDFFRLLVISALFILPLCILPSKATSDPNVIELQVPNVFIDNEATWAELGNFLKTTHYHTYILDWQGRGGRVDMAHKFIQDMQEAERQGKVVIIHIIGLSASMHAVSTCYATKVIQDGTILYHADAIFNFRLPRNMSEIDGDLSVCIAANLMTEANRTKLWEGFEVWRESSKYTWYNPDPRPLWR